ncbi:MAG: 4-hydroxythreonine-4-phosphate dehydrogenase PdxA [Gammaproteobacteria bacterium]|nr:4-hydroxythreonine-4-phosphate dehydrogenase PdxA [Gammaproteobacteria bacterium]
MAIPRILITTGEPAGIGPELCLDIARLEWPALLVAVGDPELLGQRAALTGSPVEIDEFDSAAEAIHRPGHLPCITVPLATESFPGRLDQANSAQVVECIRLAANECMAGSFNGLVTAPVHKGIINDAGIRFSGHTEMLAELSGHTSNVVMMLLAGDLRVALATTHLPLREVADAITAEKLEYSLRVLHRELQKLFGIENPRVLVCGLNPHAGEGGYLGSEDNEIIAPVIERLHEEGLAIRGPLPADTVFTQQNLEQCDAVMAMYHDQGLPVLKHAGFGKAVNITLGLPLIRTSVDHGTALDLAGTGKASSGSLQAAIGLAIELATNRITDNQG